MAATASYIPTEEIKPLKKFWHGEKQDSFQYRHGLKIT
jgi:hypothetical protein